MNVAVLGKKTVSNTIQEATKALTVDGSNEQLLVFDSDLGWMALLVAGESVRQLAFGDAKAEQTQKRIMGRYEPQTRKNRWQRDLVDRLQAFAAGAPVEFQDIEIGWGKCTDFRRAVWNACRKIPYGRTVSYAELAISAGKEGAARAVGNCMAANRVPLLIPCHRVLLAHGKLGNYSAAGGRATKKRLLDLEAKKFF